MRKAKITVAIITKNEERNIKACIDRLKGWANEIIVVDGYSEDATTKIADALGAKVISHYFEGDFAKERNIAMEKSTGDWVLHIDADDRVTDEFKAKVDLAIDSAGDIDIFKFKRKNFFIGHFMKNGGWYHYIPNLVRRKAVTYEGALHERPIYKGNMGVIEADIEHYPFDSIEQFVTRHNRYSTIEAEKMFKEKGFAELRNVKKKAVWGTVKKFWKMYFKKQGYKEGIYGLVFSVLFAFTNFLIWAKYWECAEKSKSAPGGRV